MAYGHPWSGSGGEYRLIGAAWLKIPMEWPATGVSRGMSTKDMAPVGGLGGSRRAQGLGVRVTGRAADAVGRMAKRRRT
jgi:hypothetical protein